MASNAPKNFPTENKFQPTLKLEMFAPPPEPTRPYGYYNPFVPTLKPKYDDNGRFSASAFNNLMLPTYAYSCGPNVQIPMQKVYNINLPGPTGGHVEMNKIYENILPGKDIRFTSITLGERLTMYDYVRQILVQINDGENISLDSDGHRSLMSYIKFMELNPNYYSPLYNNPYKGLPYGLLIYRSCFPIQLDAKSQSVICAKESIGLNIRLYSLTIAEYYSYKFRQPIYKEYDVWREVAYYEYVRENIIKTRQSPNFPILYAFFLSPNRKIDFFSLKKGCLTQKDMLTREYQRFLEVHKLRNIEPNKSMVYRPLTISDYGRRNINKLPDEIDIELQFYSGTTLIVITEAPTQNLYQWASRIYETEGIVKRMISSGFYNEDVWLNILFQIIYGLYILQIHGIYVRNMTIEDNIYIKDLPSSGQSMGYWKYVINGIPYYLPNYGYIVLIDTNFKDIVPQMKTLGPYKREYKIYTSNIFGKSYSMESVRKKVFDNFRNIINTNAFTKEHTYNNVMKPPEYIMTLIGKMMEYTDPNLEHIFIKYFRQFLNNRIGTLLRKDTEVPNIREFTTSFKNGEMAVEVIEENLYKWCIIIEQEPDGFVKILTKEKPNIPDFIEKRIRMETLKQYPSSERIEQNFNGTGTNFSEDSLLETYIIN